MPRQRAIRFPDDLHDAIEAEARRLGHPHTFSSVIVNAARMAIENPYSVGSAAGMPNPIRTDTRPDSRTWAESSVQRGSPSPSLERARQQMANKRIT